MMKEIHITFVRHGTTKYNEEDRVQGSSDIPLSKKGFDEINNVHIEDPNFDAFFHSPLSRSKDTLLGIMEKYNMSNNNIFESHLISERSYGVFEGLTKRQIEIQMPRLYNKWCLNENVVGEKIEPIECVIDRVEEFIAKIISYEYENILAVTHSGLLYALFKYITKRPLHLKPSQIEESFPNCCVCKLILNLTLERMEMTFIVNNNHYKKILTY